MSVNRKAKYIIFTFSKEADNFYIVNHLSLSGGWMIRPLTDRITIHTRLTLTFEKNGKGLAADFIDARHFGKLEFYYSKEFWGEKLQNKLSTFGPDTLTDSITYEILNQRIHTFVEDEPRLEIKSLLMEQTFLAGIGNIYASEICFLAGINPYRKATTLTQEEIHQLEEAIPAVIKTAYENNGSTIKTTSKSNWTDRMVYGMKYCRLCNSPISKGPQAGRKTWWCPKCQSM